MEPKILNQIPQNEATLTSKRGVNHNITPQNEVTLYGFIGYITPQNEAPLYIYLFRGSCAGFTQ